jgi:N6-L-threonylcarbamoyladenine synthase
MQVRAYNPEVLAAIETSFDDTGIAIGNRDGLIIASLLSSQSAHHQEFRGVVPELAARTHLQDLPHMWRELRSKVSEDSFQAIGVTAGPGLPGSLLAGVNFARGLSAWYDVPLIGLNHLEGHVFSPFMPADTTSGREIPYPHLALIVSGGHTELFLVKSLIDLQLLGQTSDDAVGELLDKVSALLELGYPGGARLEELAEASNLLDEAAHYPGRPFLPIPLQGSRTLAFSFSGLKTAVVRKVRSSPEVLMSEGSQEQAALLACLFSVILDSLWEKVALALESHSVKALTVSGGVAINKLLRRRFAAETMKLGLPLFFPLPRHCLDNAEMMLWLLALKLQAGIVARSFDIKSSWLPGQ